MSTRDPRTASAVLGTMTFGDTVDEQRAGEIVAAALDAGIDSIDTANGYAGGESERILGAMMSDIGGRATLATKAGIPHPDAAGAAPLSADGIRRSLDGSLRRLGVDSVELFYLHQPDAATPIRESLLTLRGLLEEGLIRSYGISNFAAWQLVEICGVADELGMPHPAVAQQLYNLVSRRIDSEYLAAARHVGVPLMVYNPLAGGLLAASPAAGAAQSRFTTSRLAEMYSARYLSDGLRDAVTQIDEVARLEGTSIRDLSLRWLTHSQDVASVLLGASKVSHILDNVASLSAAPLGDAALSSLDRIATELAGPMPAYNR